MTEMPVTTIAPIIKRLNLPLEPEAAFRLFTERAASWWPLVSHSVGGDDAVNCVLEGRVGGRFYEVRRDGTKDTWGTVLVWDPPRHVAFSMHPGLPVETAGRVDVQFEASGGGTQFTLTHSGWENCGPNARTMRDGYDGGWDKVLRPFVEIAEIQQT